MSNENLENDIRHIKEAVDGLASKISDGLSVTGDEDYSGVGHSLEGLGSSSEDSGSTISNIVIDAKISSAKSEIGEKVAVLEKDVYDKIHDLDREFRSDLNEAKPNYLKIIFSILIPTLFLIAGIFFGLIPVQVENAINKRDTNFMKNINSTMDSIETRLNEHAEVLQEVISDKKDDE